MEGQHTDISVFAQTGGRNLVSESTEFEVLLPQGHFVHTLRRIQGLRGPSDSCGLTWIEIRALPVAGGAGISSSKKTDKCELRKHSA